MSEWETLESRHPIWKPTKPGEVLEGTVINLGEAFDQKNADIQTKAGIRTTPAHVNLSGSVAQLNPGDYVKITYKGITKGKRGKNDFASYDVLRKKAKATE